MFNRPLVAIDIGSSAIKVVELGGVKQKKLRAAGLEVLPVGAVVDGVVQDGEAVEKVLRGLLKRLKIRARGRRAALALSGSTVLIKRINVTAKNNELAEQVYFEAEQQFQADMTDIYFDFFQIKPDAKAEEEQPVLLVGAKRDMVEQYLGLMRSVGLRTGVVECGVFSVANMFEYNYGHTEGLAALVTVGASLTQLSLIASGEFLYTRDIPIGGDEYSRRIMEAMSVDRDNAEGLKVAASQEGGGGVPSELHRVIGELNDQLVSELHTSVDYFLQGGNSPGGLTSLFLTGGGARILGLDAAIAASLQIPVQILNPFQRVEVNPNRFKMDYILMQGHLYGVAVGLGLRATGDND